MIVATRQTGIMAVHVFFFVVVVAPFFPTCCSHPRFQGLWNPPASINHTLSICLSYPNSIMSEVDSCFPWQIKQDLLLGREMSHSICNCAVFALVPRGQ